MPTRYSQLRFLERYALDLSKLGFRPKYITTILESVMREWRIPRADFVMFMVGARAMRSA
jgi:hypothetical protein